MDHLRLTPASELKAVATGPIEEDQLVDVASYGRCRILSLDVHSPVRARIVRAYATRNDFIQGLPLRNST